MAKSPLAQAFGIALQNKRQIAGLDVESVTSKVNNMTASYYRAVEAGTYNLHVSNAFELCKAFDDGNFGLHLPGVIHMLGVISILEVASKEHKEQGGNLYADSFYSKFVEITLGITDPKMKVVRERFEAAGVFEMLKTNTADEIRLVIIESGIAKLVEDFISILYENIGEENSKVFDQFTKEFFRDFNTLYHDHLMDIKRSINKLPNKYDYRSSWVWENENVGNIIRVVGMSSEKNIIISRLRARKYTYNYLSHKNFDKGRFIFLSGEETTSELKEEFAAELSSAIKANPSQEARIENLEVELDKVEFANVQDHTFNINHTLTKVGKNIQFNAFWIFTLSDGFYLGVKAFVETGTWKVVEAEYLTFGETKRLLKIFNRMWERKNVKNPSSSVLDVAAPLLGEGDS